VDNAGLSLYKEEGSTTLTLMLRSSSSILLSFDLSHFFLDNRVLP
jgi:hypothetical protein